MWALIQCGWFLIERGDWDRPREGLVKTQRENGHKQAKERGLLRNQPCRHLDLGLLAFRMVRA